MANIDRPVTEAAAAPSRPFDDSLAFVPCVEVGIEYFETAPIRFRFSVDLPIRPDQLFDVLRDPASWPRWAQGIGRVDWTSPEPFGPGTTRTVTFWGGMKVYEDFFVWDSPREMAFSFYGTSEKVWTSFAEHYAVDDLGDAGCRLTWRVAYEPTGGFGRIHPLLKPIMKLNLGSYMWRLKRYCKRQQRSAQS